jgi:hypothetical protein
MAKRPRRKADEVLDIPVKFGGMSVKGEQAKIAIVLQRDHVTLSQVDWFLVESQCDTKIVVNADAAKDAPGQTFAFDTAKGVLEAPAISRKVSIGRSTFGTQLCFQSDAVDVKSLAKFNSASGRLSMVRIGDSKVAKPDDDDDDEGEELIEGEGDD